MARLFRVLNRANSIEIPKRFYRANRQFIIHIDAIQSVKPHENAKLTALLKAPLKFEVDISREKVPVFKKWLDR